MSNTLSDYTGIVIGFSFWIFLIGLLWLWTKKRNRFTKVLLWIGVASLVLHLFRPGGFINVLASGIFLTVVFSTLYALDLANARENIKLLAEEIKSGRFTSQGRDEYGLYPIVAADDSSDSGENATAPSPDEVVTGPDGTPLVVVDDELRPLSDRRMPETSVWRGPENKPWQEQGEQETRQFRGGSSQSE